MLTEKPQEKYDQRNCTWTSWMNNDLTKKFGNDNNSYEVLRKEGHVFCAKPINIECSYNSLDVPVKPTYHEHMLKLATYFLQTRLRLVVKINQKVSLNRDRLNPESDFSLARQPNVECDVTNGLVCDYKWGRYCKDYELRVHCCQPCQTKQIEKTTESYFESTNNNLADMKDGYGNSHYIEINENWIPALILFFLMFMMTSTIVLLLFKRRGKRRSKKIKTVTTTKSSYQQNKFFDFANFSHNFEAKFESNRSDLLLMTPSSGGDYDASAVFSVNHDDVITYTTSVACSETQASSSIIDPLERVRRSLKKSEPPRVPDKIDVKFDESVIKNDDSGIADVDVSDLNIEDCVKNIQSLLDDDDKSQGENETFPNNVNAKKDLNEPFVSDRSFSSLVSQQYEH